MIAYIFATLTAKIDITIILDLATDGRPLVLPRTCGEESIPGK
jgi:hypothetical protein